MKNWLILSALPFTAACATAPAPLHDRPANLSANEDVWCLAPGGEILPWDDSSGRRDAPGREVGRCPAPAAFVRVPICNGESWHEETPQVRAARARFGRDGSLHGDRFQGLRFCIPLPPS
jgi:hypothetical protein